MKKEKKFNEYDFQPILYNQEGEREKRTKKKKYRLFNEALYAGIHVIIDRPLVEKVKDYAYSEKLTIKDVVTGALREFFATKGVENRPKEVD
jgi:hypothetical protein